MRYFIGCIALVLVYSGCSSTETTQQPVEDEQEIQPMMPSWYSDGIHSASDSLALHGFSFASATDSSRAAELSTQHSLRYLRFEIDRLAEEIRQDLADSDDGAAYNSPSFIIQLRRTVSQLPLDSASFDSMHNVSDRGIHYSYQRATLQKTALYNLFENRLEDNRFLQQIRNLSN
ncbi:MAG: hypothetical protein R3220_00185 [Balneolaceae bacterium]|nr:hypothetical protein [Balneolaceae bacterium]